MEGGADALTDCDAAGIRGDRVLPPEAEEFNPRATGDAWTPQQTAEHAVSAVTFFRGLIAAAMEQEGEPPQRTPFRLADEAAAALTVTAAAAAIHDLGGVRA